MESCLAAQKHFLLFKDPGPGVLKFFLDFLKAYRLVPLTFPFPGHFTVPLTFNNKHLCIVKFYSWYVP
jgi:hypothetical protein